MGAHGFGTKVRWQLWALAILASVFVFGMVTPAFAQPHFSVSPHDPPDHIWAREFSPSSAVTISIDDPGTPASWDYTEYTSTDGDGNFDFQSSVDFWEGWQIEVSDGLVTKGHTVYNVWFDGVDPDTDTCWGYGEANSGIAIWFYDEDLMQHVQRDVTTDFTGYWFADFSVAQGGLPQEQVADIKITSTVTAGQPDADGDATQVNGQPVNPQIIVFPNDEFADGWRWDPDQDVTIDVDDPATPEPVDFTTTAHTNGEGNLYISWMGEYDVQPGFVVTATSGPLSTSTTVTGLTIDGADPDADLIWGTAAPSSGVWVDASSGEHSYVQADESGDWSLSAATDLTLGTHITAYQEDDDADRTQVNYYISNPRIAADREQDRVTGWEWPANTGLFVTVDSAWVADVTTDEWGNFDVFLGPSTDLVEGSVVSVTDGLTVKTTTITALTITGVDPAEDTVFGTAAPDSYVHVWVNGMPGTHRMVQADGAGDWLADFTDPEGEEGAHDIVPGDQGEANQEDEDWDQTRVEWRVANPAFGVDPDRDEVFGGDFEPWATVSIDIDDPGTPASPDYSTTADTDDWGNFGISTSGEYNVQPGLVVSVSDGVNAREHTVTDIQVTAIDTDLDTVAGVAAPGAWVTVDVYGVTWRTVQADGAGDWLADFASDPEGHGTADISLGTEGEAREHDADSDYTRVVWRVLNPNIGVDAHMDEVFGGDFEPWATVSIDIDDPGTPASPDYSTTSDADDWGNFGTSFGQEFDLQPGHEVTASDGVTTKSHTVAVLEVTGIDVDLDTISGTGPADSWVWVSVWDEGASRLVETAPDGSWTADFSLAGDGEWPVDIQRGYQGEATWHDAENDFTRAMWRVPNPSFGVDPERDEVWGGDFAALSSVSIEIDDPGTPATPDFSTSADTDDWGNFGTWVGSDIDIQPGFLITVTDGVIYREHTVTSLTVTGVDPEFDTVSGTAAPDAWVTVDVYGMAWRNVQADGSGDWTADFSAEGNGDGTADIGPGTEGEAREHDDDGDNTRAMWRVPNPSFGVDPATDDVWGQDMEALSSVIIDVDDPGTPEMPDYSTTADTDDWGNFGVWVGESFDIQPGFEVTVTDPVRVKSHTVTGLTITGVDPDADTVSGTAEPDSWVHVMAYGMAWRHVQADLDGNWIAYFMLDGDGEQGYADIGPGTEGEATQDDDDYDYTRAVWRLANPCVGVDAQTDQIWGGDMADPVTITVDDPGTPEPTDYETTVGTDEWGNYDVWVGDVFDIQPGHQVTVSDGVSLKTHTVTAITVTSVDVDLDTVSGTAAPDAWVGVQVWGGAWRNVQADGAGDWTADFSVPGAGDDEQETFDIGPGSEGDALEFDEDGDHTRAMWRIPNPHFGVDPEREEVWGSDLEPLATVSIDLDDPGTPQNPDYHTTADTDEWGNFGIWTGDVFDVVPGLDITVDDGVRVKTHVVTSLTVTEIDPDLDRVYGVADPDAWVDVDVYGTASRRVQADGAGNWMADFADDPDGMGTADIGLGTEGEAREADEDWDYTRDAWRVLNPSFGVGWNEDWIGGGDFAAWSTVTVSVDDPATPEEPDFETTADTDDWGGFWTSVGEFYDIALGDLVTVSDGVTTKTHEVVYVEVAEVDPELDTVSGYADPFAHVWVSVDDNGANKEVDADVDGLWTADFSAGEEWEIADIVPGSQGGAQRYDDDNDCSQWSWYVANPHFSVRREYDTIAIWEFPALVDVRVTIDDPATPAPVDFDEYVASDEWGYAELWVDPATLDLAAGQEVVVSYDTIVKTHTVTTLSITAIDHETDTISGTADYGSAPVVLHTWAYEWEWWVDPDIGGIWTMTDMPIEPGDSGNAEQRDDDGDLTEVFWYVANPAFSVAPGSDEIWGWDWAPLSDVTITVDDPATPAAPDESLIAPTDEMGWFGVDPGALAVDPGFVVSVDDGSTLKEHVVWDLTAAVDADTDIVSGTLSPDGEVWVDAWTESEGQTRSRMSDAGTWDVDFSQPDGDLGPLDLVPGDSGQAYVFDDDGDQTAAPWHIPQPRFRASPVWDEVSGEDWPVDTALLVTWDDLATPASPDVTTSTVSSGIGDFVVPLGEEGVDVGAGDVITVTDGTVLKSHMILPLQVMSVDIDTDTVTGIAEPNSWVWASIDDEDYWFGHHVQADGDGNWTADFANPDEGPTWDIVDGTWGNANQADDDADETWVPWRAQSPMITVTPATDSLWGDGFIPGGTVTITVDDPGTPASPDHTLPGVSTDEWWGQFRVEDVGYDITAGDIVTVDDGATTKSHTVTALAVGGADVTADVVYGTSDSADSVFVGYFPGGWMDGIEADWTGPGSWEADFTTVTDPVLDLFLGVNGGARQEDADGDSTWVDWATVVPEPADDAASTAEDTQLVAAAPGVLGNDTYNAGETTIEVVTQPAHGTLNMNASTGAWTYTPASNWNGTDTFTYLLTEDGTDSDSATVTITVTAANDAPVALNDTASVDQDSVLVVPAPGVLANDSDPDSDPISAVLHTDAQHGTLSLLSDGGYTYTPDTGFTGTDTFVYRAYDGTAYSGQATVTITVQATELEVVPIAGDNRYETSVAVSEQAFPDGADWVVIATGRNWPDALGGSALAGALEGPILLTDTFTVPGSVIDEIERLGATDAIILGGTSAVGASVETQLNALLGDANVERIAGANRYGTADLVGARTISVLGTGFDGTALMATGANYPDALAAAPLSAGLNWPLFLTRPTGIAASTQAAMAGVDEVLVLGGTSAVPALIEQSLNATYGDADVTRLSGANRYATAVAVASHGVASGLGWDRLAIATGENFPDALAGGVLQGRDGSVMLLTKTAYLDANVASVLEDNKDDITEVRFFGGPAAVSQAVRDAVANILE